MEKIFIKNRKEQKIAVLLEGSENQKGLAFVMHGLGGFKEQPHLQIISETFLAHGYAVVRFDATNSFGESDGNYENATVTNYYEDLEDIIGWASKQGWYKQPFVLVGHSLGGGCVSLFAEKYPEKVKGLAPTSTVVSGELSVQAHRKFMPEKFEQWEETGWLEEASNSKPGVVKRLKWSHLLDRLKLNLLDNAENLKMPVLLVAGDQDTKTPLDHQQIFYNALPARKELHVVNGAPHTFKDPKHLSELKGIFENWIKSL